MYINPEPRLINPKPGAVSAVDLHEAHVRAAHHGEGRQVLQGGVRHHRKAFFSQLRRRSVSSETQGEQERERERGKDCEERYSRAADFCLHVSVGTSVLCFKRDLMKTQKWSAKTSTVQSHSTSVL